MMNGVTSAVKPPFPVGIRDCFPISLPRLVDEERLSFRCSRLSQASPTIRLIACALGYLRRSDGEERTVLSLFPLLRSFRKEGRPGIKLPSPVSFFSETTSARPKGEKDPVGKTRRDYGWSDPGKRSVPLWPFSSP